MSTEHKRIAFLRNSSRTCDFAIHAIVNEISVAIDKKNKLIA